MTPGCGSSYAANARLREASSRCSRNATGRVNRRRHQHCHRQLLVFLEARHHAPASKTASATPKTLVWAGFRHATPRSSTPGLSAVAIAADLTAWLHLLALTGTLAKAEPKALRYQLLHVPP